MYSIIAGMDLPGRPLVSAVGVRGRQTQVSSSDKDIVLDDWLAKDLEVKIGEQG